MATYKITNSTYFVGAIDWHRRLFDSLIPLPEGTSYNSYLIRGSEKTALVESVDPSKYDELVANLESLGVEQIDYIISNHAEQDHSGSLPNLLDRYPQAKVVTNAKCKGLLEEHLGIEGDKFITVGDEETISLGDKHLKFIIAPWVHWPETMFTYLVEDKILFPCDFLGSHLAPSQLLVESIDEFYEGAKRYYAEIMMPFRTSVLKHLDRLKDYEISIIAPSHGPVHLNPKPIMDAYRKWASDEVENEVVLPFVSMHGSTAKMVEYLTERLIERGIRVKPFDLVGTDIGKLAMALVDAATLVVAAPTVLVGPHPLAVYATYLANALRPKIRFLGIIGSYGWGSKMLDDLKGLVTNLKVELLPAVIVRGYPKDDDLKALENLADEILSKHKQLNLL